MSMEHRMTIGTNRNQVFRWVNFVILLNGA